MKSDGTYSSSLTFFPLGAVPLSACCFESFGTITEKSGAIAGMIAPETRVADAPLPYADTSPVLAGSAKPFL